MHIYNPITPKTGVILSAMVLVLPVLSWFSIFMFVVFGQTYFMDEVFAKIDSVSSIFTIAILVGFPLLAIILINIPYLDFLMEKKGSELTSKFTLKVRLLPKLVTAGCALIIISALLAGFKDS